MTSDTKSKLSKASSFASVKRMRGSIKGQKLLEIGRRGDDWTITIECLDPPWEQSITLDLAQERVPFLKAEDIRNMFVHGGIRIKTMQSSLGAPPLKDVFDEMRAAIIRTTPKASREPLRRITLFIDWLPSAGLRKKVRTLVTDEKAEISELYKANRDRVARWRERWVWVHAIGYVVGHPIDALVISLIKKFHIGGG